MCKCNIVPLYHTMTLLLIIRKFSHYIDMRLELFTTDDGILIERISNYLIDN